MTTVTKKYDFADAAVPSLLEIQGRVASDPSFPEQRRGQVLSSLNQFAQWSASVPESLPFTPQVLRAKLSRLTPGGTGRSKKRLQNVRSDINFVMKHFDLSGQASYLAPLTPAWNTLLDSLQTGYEGYSLKRLMQFASARGIAPDEIDDDVGGEFLAAMVAEEVLKDPSTNHKNAIRAWNRAVDRYEFWPRSRLLMPVYREFWGKPWSAFPPALEQSVDAFLNAGRPTGVDDLFSDSAASQPLKPTTVKTQNLHLRLAATIVSNNATVGTLADLSTPTAFKWTIGALIDRHGRGVTPYIAQVAWTLTKAARHGGGLSESEIKDVNHLFKKVTIRQVADARGKADRDQATLDCLDDADKMDALLSLPARVAEATIRTNRRSRREALEIQKALALELWLCAPLRISNFVALDLDRHVVHVTVSGKQRTVIRIAAEDTKNGEPLEHFLHEDAVTLLKLYVEVYLPRLLTGSTNWLFPGEKNQHKDPAPFRIQMKKFIRDKTGLDFHPHLIRKIVTKICLDDDPGAIEIARRCLGHRDERTTRKSYTQKQNRSAHQRYLTALEGRRLSAFKKFDRT